MVTSLSSKAEETKSPKASDVSDADDDRVRWLNPSRPPKRKTLPNSRAPISVRHRPDSLDWVKTVEQRTVFAVAMIVVPNRVE